MNAVTTSIVNAYESEEMTPEEIAQVEELELPAVKATLMQYSSIYRKACGKEGEVEDDLNFTNDDLRRVNQVIMDLALGAEDDTLRFKAATFVRDDKKGRREVVKAMAGQNFNILMINERLRQVKDVTSRIKSVVNKQVGEQKAIVNV